MQGRERVAIVGAGIGGLAAALALARAGRSVVVHEQATELTEAGAGVQLSPNAVRTLRWLGVDGALARFAVRPEAVEVRRGRDDALLLRTPLGAAAEARWGAPYWHVRRADLHAVLARAAQAEGVGLRLGVRIEAPGEVDADVLVAADGVRSPLRAALIGGPAARPTGQVAWRGTVAATDASHAPVAQVRLGAGRHLVSYRVAGGAEVNVVAVVDEAGWSGEGWTAPGDPAELARAFAGFSSAALALLAAIEAPVRWAVLDRDPAPRWSVGRSTLLGDAAHPVPPFLAQGAALALEDAVVLARRLDAHADPAEALTAYEAARRPRATRVLMASRRNGRLFHLGGPIVDLGHTLARLAPATAARAAAPLDWLYGYDAVSA